jgi:TM2 domain-containing membrane protein YozV
MSEDVPAGLDPALPPAPARSEDDHAEESPSSAEEAYAHPYGARFVAPALAWLFPGAGHFYLGRRGKAAVFLVLVAVSLAVGFALDGKIYSPQDGDMFTWFGSYACLGLGPVYFIFKALTFTQGDPFSAWAEYGNRFVLTAGIMNLILMLDAFDVAVGRKDKSL